MIIGVCGKISSGKSIFCQYVSSKFNFKIINVDLLAKAILKKKEIISKLNIYFPDLVNLGKINIYIFKKMIFNDEKFNYKFNIWFKPYLEEEIKKIIEVNNNKKILIDCAIFNILNIHCDLLITIKARDELLLKRTINRVVKDYEINYIKNIINIQNKLFSIKNNKCKSEIIIINNYHDVFSFYKKIKILFKNLKINKNQGKI